MFFRTCFLWADVYDADCTGEKRAAQADYLESAENRSIDSMPLK